MYQQRMLRKTQSNPLHSASSLPDLLSETLYECPLRTPAPYIYFVATTSPTSNPVNADSGVVTSDVFSIESMKQKELQTATQTAQPYANAKTRVSRLHSAPQEYEYAEPLNGEMRARFYSYRGMRLSSLTNRAGALKKPMPLPDNTTGPKHSATSTTLETTVTSVSEEREFELETTLDSIEEMDEQQSPPLTP